MDVLAVVEAILDDPFPVLMAQAHKARGEAVAEMKAQGIEYDERMELLEEVSYPKPLGEGLLDALRGVRFGDGGGCGARHGARGGDCFPDIHAPTHGRNR